MSDFPRPPRPPRPTLVPTPVTNDDLSLQLTNLRIDMSDAIEAVRQELALLRAIVTDHVPRVAAVEKSMGSKAMNVTKWIGVATLALSVAGQIAASFRPDLVGPIESLKNLLIGTGQ